MTDLAIILCPNCGVKNRIRSYNSEKIPVCAKCKAKLVSEKEHAAFSNLLALNDSQRPETFRMM